MQNLPPPPPPPLEKPAAPRTATPPFDIVVCCIAVATLLGILVFLVPRHRSNHRVDNVIRLDAPVSADATPAAGRPAVPDLPPLHVGDVVDLTVEGISPQSGNGMLHYGDAPVYIPDAQPGQTVRVRILSERTPASGRRYFNAEIVPPETPLAKADSSNAPPPQPEAGNGQRETPPTARPLAIGDIVDLTVETLSEKTGNGMLRYGDAPVYIPGAQPGQTVHVRITADKTSKSGKRYFEAEIVPPETAPAKVAPSSAPPPPSETGNGQRETSQAAQPLAVGDIVDLTVEETATKSGDGMLRYGDATVYIPGAQPGQTVRVRILSDKTSKSGRRYFNAEAVPPETPLAKADPADRCPASDRSAGPATTPAPENAP